MSVETVQELLERISNEHIARDAEREAEMQDYMANYDVVTSTEIIGWCSVDSGTIMIVDPCYVLPDNRPNLPPHEPSFPAPGSEHDSVYLDATKFVSNNADAPKHHTWMHGVVMSTLYGDGGYPVKAFKNKFGRIIKVEINFNPGDEEEE